ncbi:Cytochrome c1 heme lyase [Entomortierella beljakovae]|nr:Cytochrome c1 heme lyase [Entomortierella beljakovae]
MTDQESQKTGNQDSLKCPVDHSTFQHYMPKNSESPEHPALPEGHPQVPSTSADGEALKCPVSPEAHKHFMPRPTQQDSSQASSANTKAKEAANLKIDPTNNMPSTPDQFRIASQQSELNTERESSTIPKSTDSPDPYGDDKKSFGAHPTDPDTDKEKVWIYPSEQMFFNAMKRKNWNPREEDMKFVVPIHNMVNEMAWKHILRWEKLTENTCGGPKLVKFEGKPKEITPKARVRSWMGYTLPFDRHDWVVDRCGKQVTYIIDFYSGQPDPRYPEAPSFYLDVRPKLTMDGAWLRFKKFMFD